MPSPTIFLVAGEPSGDALGAALIRSLRAQRDDLVICGVGGPEMEAEGLESLFPMSDLAVMGLVEVLPRARAILRRLRETAEAVARVDPAVVVTIDTQGFSWRLAKRLQPSPRPLVYYVAPTVWAWKPRRAHKVSRLIDRVLLLFPFEKPYWDAVDQDAVFVGHPVADAPVERERARELHTVLRGGRDGPLLALLPGSRTGEIRRHLGLFGEVAERIAKERPGLSLVIPTVANVADLVRAETASWTVPLRVMEVEAAERRSAMAACDAALAVSGTVALDLAAAGTPHVIAYRANPITFQIVRRMVSIAQISLVNLIAGRPVTPELIQHQCTPEALFGALDPLIDDGEPARAQREAMSAVISALRPQGETSSTTAARAILEMITTR
ncbi:MAG: lipid-A-disaccharide synthase [Rhodospirillales bacterium]|nr:lipid-A-disaccharide synthase [Rhodospirillales bacterium]